MPDEDELPESLRGFDLAAGLSRLMGNKRLYRKLLLDFGTNYSGVAGEIREALAAKDFKQAHSLVHNLKGLSGNLEATDLQTAAVEMEKLVKGQTAKTTSDKELNRKFAKLENALEQALDAVQTLGPSAKKKTIESSEDAWSSVPPELIKKATESIKEAADMGDVTQIKSIAEELMCAWHGALTELLAQAGSHKMPAVTGRKGDARRAYGSERKPSCAGIECCQRCHKTEPNRRTRSGAGHRRWQIHG